MEDVYLCDIDGTLAHNNGHRSFYDESKVEFDTTLPTVNIINSLMRDNNKIIFFSGRTESCRNKTIEWLYEHLVIDFDNIELHMRSINDQRSDDILKEEMYNKYVNGKYNILAVFDDRPKVVRMWWKLGLFAFNCAQSNKEF